jgi:MoaA/NifB/PqqE/SkfB family radical SAM enzyme
MQKKHKIYSGFNVKLQFLRMEFCLILHLIKSHGLTKKSYQYLRNILNLKNNFTIENHFKKMVKHNGKIYLNCNIPGLPFYNFHERLLSLSSPNSISNLGKLGIVQIGFTKKCPLNCEHCYEGKILNQPESLSLAEHQLIISKLQESGIPMIQFGGGEPMNRFEDLIHVLGSAEKTSDFWIYSSGFGLSYEKAKLLKEHGLTGVSISLDHYLKDEHNAFRRNNKSYDKALEAILNSQKAGLLTAMTICVTRDFCSEANLDRYHQLAHQLEVPFVQLMEPRATGNYENHDVMLKPEHLTTLEQFYISRNSKAKYAHLPIIQYTGYQQRQKGCAGAGNTYIYIDTDGYIHSCPFCRNKKSHFLYGDVNKDLIELKNEGCYLTRN